jgi:hypothetical protein
VRKSFTRITLALAGLAGAAVGVVGKVLPGLAGLVLVAYGAWLAWPPAGFIAAGVLLLADRAWEQARTLRETR